MRESIFSTLYKHCSGAEENYLTDAFAYTLRFLLRSAPKDALNCINTVCGLSGSKLYRDPKTIHVTTQVSIDQGRPDMEIRDDHVLTYIEVKHDSPLSTGQLERYQKQLRAANHPFTQLVLLTRSRISVAETTLSINEYHHIRWCDVYDYLDRITWEDQVCTYIVTSFLYFLQEKNMAMRKVSWEYMQGVPALMYLTQMLGEALATAMPHVSRRRTAGWTWRGFYTATGYYVGMNLTQPNGITFQNNLGNAPTYRRDLDFDKAHFFSLTSGDQFECIVSFLQNALAEAPKSDQPIDLDKAIRDDIVETQE